MAGLFTIYESCTFESKIKRSRFIAHLCPVRTAAEVKSFVSEISSLHSTANHNCWAYILGDKAEIEHASDQGEPPGTAGKPMLNVLLKHKLTNVAVVVTRYFGGTKLGIPGLIEAYSTIVEQALTEAQIIPLVNVIPYVLQTSYTNHDFIKHQLAESGAMNIESSFTENVQITFEIEEENSAANESFLEEMKKTKKIDNWIRVNSES